MSLDRDAERAAPVRGRGVARRHPEALAVELEPDGALARLDRLDDGVRPRVDPHDRTAELVRDPDPVLADREARGASPTGMVADTALVPGSIRETVPSRVLPTHTASAPASIGPGELPTPIRWSTRPVRGSMRDTLASVSLVTQTAPAPTAMPIGDPPTGAVQATRPLSRRSA